MRKSGKLVQSPGSIQLGRTSTSPFPLSQALLQEFSQQTQSSGSGISDWFVPWINIHSEMRQEQPIPKIQIKSSRWMLWWAHLGQSTSVKGFLWWSVLYSERTRFVLMLACKIMCFQRISKNTNKELVPMLQ